MPKNTTTPEEIQNTQDDQHTPETGAQEPAPATSQQQPNNDSQDPQEPQEQAQQDEQEPTGGKRGGGNPEAAKYRRQLREVEAERDQLAAELQELKRSNLLKEHNIPEQFHYLIHASGTEEEFAKSLQDISRLVNQPGVVYKSGTGNGYVEDEPSWADAITGNH